MPLYVRNRWIYGGGPKLGRSIYRSATLHSHTASSLSVWVGRKMLHITSVKPSNRIGVMGCAAAEQRARRNDPSAEPARERQRQRQRPSHH
jgi:hypothetical protein